jgi:hypothetical protein
MYATTSTKRPGRSYGAYVCADRFRERSACDNPQIAESMVTEQVLAYLEAMRSSAPAAATPTSAYDPQRELECQRATLGERRSRLLLLFETGRIDLPTYDQRTEDLDRELGRVQTEINALAERRVKAVRTERSITALAEAQLRTIVEGDQADANRWLRGVLSRIWIDNRLVTDVEL